MKRNVLHTLWLAAAVLLAASCSQEEFTEAGKENVQTLSFAITDGGYAATADHNGSNPAGAPQTRAVESGYTTEFTAGDACGLYIVRGGKLVYTNVKLTATAAKDGTGALTWQPADESIKLAGGFPDEAYYLYYPYQEDMTGKTASTPAAGMRDDEFFAPLISEWQVKPNQSDYVAGYTASDLMTATATTEAAQAGKLQLTFTMKHRMALAVIELPRTKYVFSNTPTIPDYIAPTAADFTESQAKPYRMADGNYRYLVNPVATAPKITGSYADGKREFTITPSAASGSYKTYKIDGAETVEQTYTLQVGDYFCSNADAKEWYIIPNKLAPTVNDNCIGIVFYPGRHDKDDQSDYKEPLATGRPTLGNVFHGYVVALTDVHNDSDDRLKWEYGPNNVYDQRVGASTATDDWNGYYNCLKIHEFVAQNFGNGWDMKHFPAALACETYGNRKYDQKGEPVTGQYNWQKPFAAPSNTSGWFLPSCGQLKYLYDNREFLSSQIRTVGDNTSSMEVKNYIKWFSTSWYYWSSSEGESHSSNASYVSFNDGDVYTYGKYHTRDVRAVLAF